MTFAARSRREPSHGCAPTRQAAMPSSPAVDSVVLGMLAARAAAAARRAERGTNLTSTDQEVLRRVAAYWTSEADALLSASPVHTQAESFAFSGLTLKVLKKQPAVTAEDRERISNDLRDRAAKTRRLLDDNDTTSAAELAALFSDVARVVRRDMGDNGDSLDGRVPSAV
jgi:hypothetical protein